MNRRDLLVASSFAALLACTTATQTGHINSNPTTGLCNITSQPVAYARIRLGGNASDESRQQAIVQALQRSCAFKDVLPYSAAHALQDGEVNVDLFVDAASEPAWTLDLKHEGGSFAGGKLYVPGRSAVLVDVAVLAIAVPALVLYATLPILVPQWGTMNGWAQITVIAKNDGVIWHEELFAQRDWRVIIYPLYRTKTVLSEAEDATFNDLTVSIQHKFAHKAADFSR